MSEIILRILRPFRELSLLKWYQALWVNVGDLAGRISVEGWIARFRGDSLVILSSYA